MAFVKYSEGKITDVIEKGKELPPKTKEVKDALDKYDKIRKGDKTKKSN